MHLLPMCLHLPPSKMCINRPPPHPTHISHSHTIPMRHSTFDIQVPYTALKEWYLATTLILTQWFLANPTRSIPRPSLPHPAPLFMPPPRQLWKTLILSTSHPRTNSNFLRSLPPQPAAPHSPGVQTSTPSSDHESLQPVPHHTTFPPPPGIGTPPHPPPLGVAAASRGTSPHP